MAGARDAAVPLVLPEPASDESGGSSSSGDQAQVEVVLGRRHVLAGTKNEVRAVVRISAPPLREEGVRSRISVACVLDRSRSMTGDKINFAKRACKKLVKHLGADDTLHLITCGARPSVAFEHGDLSAGGKEALNAIIDGIQAEGATDLFGGLETAASLLGTAQPRQPGTAARGLRRIFLFSDGLITAGVSEDAHIQERVAAWAEAGIKTTTFGIGDSFNLTLMRSIASAGGGRCVFLASAQEIPRAVSKAIHGLIKVCASDVVLSIYGRSYTTLKHVGSSGEELMYSNTFGQLQLGDLHAGNSRNVLLQLECQPPPSSPDGLQFQAGQWRLSFQQYGQAREFSGSIDLIAIAERVELEGECGTVRAMFAIRNAAELENSVADFLRRRDRVMAAEVKARQLIALRETLAVAQSPESGVHPVDVRALEAVLRRAENIQKRLSEEDAETALRRVLQERDLEFAMNLSEFSSGEDSDEEERDAVPALFRRFGVVGGGHRDTGSGWSVSSAMGSEQTRLSPGEPEQSTWRAPRPCSVM